MTEKLKPCDCGSTFVDVEKFCGGLYRAYCFHCGRVGPECGTREEAVEKWNVLQGGKMTTKLKGVMIVGQKMPRTCIDCPCSQVTFYVDVYKNINETHFFCKNTSKRAMKTKRPSWCPLQEVK